MHLTGIERVMAENEIIVSKTNLKGHITYANDVFLKIADYTLAEVMEKPHSMIRHPEMPRCVFKLLWDYIQGGKEIFAYVVNRAKNGDHYWVFAHVTPSYDDAGNLVGYHSNRRKPKAEAVKVIEGLYKTLCAEEAKYRNSKEGINAGFELLLKVLKEKGISYDKLIMSI